MEFDKSSYSNIDIPEKKIIHFNNGLEDFITDQLPVDTEYVIEKKFHGIVDFPNNEGYLNWAIAWVFSSNKKIVSFCNNIPTPLGGTHEVAVRNALLKQ